MPNIKKILIFFTLVILVNFLLTSLSAQAATQMLDPNVLSNQDTAFIKETGLGTDISLGEIVSRVIKVILSFLGVIFFLLMIYAGFTWMTAAGSEEKINQAKKTMAAAVIGLAIVLAAYTITYFVIDKILEATKGGAGLD